MTNTDAANTKVNPLDFFQIQVERDQTEAYAIRPTQGVTLVVAKIEGGWTAYPHNEPKSREVLGQTRQEAVEAWLIGG